MTSFNLFLGKPSAKADAFIKMPTRYKYVNDADWRTTLIGGEIALINGSGDSTEQIANPKNIKEIIIGAGTQENPLTTIGENAFNACTNLQSVKIPNSITTIGKNAFRSTHFEEIVLPNSINTINWAVFNCSGLKSIVIPNSVTKIDGYVFSYSYSLAEITLPDTITSIGIGTFIGCNKLTTATIIANGGNANNVKQMMIDANATAITTWNMPN